jgi:hypothetical protein
MFFQDVFHGAARDRLQAELFELLLISACIPSPARAPA